MTTTLLNNWHFMRIFRAGIAIWAFSEAWRTGEWMMAVPGGFFAIQAIFDIGCCGASGCATPGQTRNQKHEMEEVAFEEVK
jgi:hypothetical protein